MRTPTTIPTTGLGHQFVANIYECRSDIANPEFVKKLPEDTRYLDRDVMQASFIFGKDISRVEEPINSMLEPRLYQVYHEETGR